MKTWQTLVLTLLIVVLMSPPAPSYELDTLLEMDLEELMDIRIVTSNKRDEGLNESPSVVQVITAREIQLLNFNTLEEVLEYATGISSIHAASLPVYVSSTIRGNTLINYQTSTLLLFDGIPIYNPFHGSFDFSWIPLSAIDRIEIVKGANSVLYGTNAVSSVINIISRNQANTELFGKARVGADRTIHGEWGHLKTYGDVQTRLFVDVTSVEGEMIDDVPSDPFISQRHETHRKNGSLVTKLDYKGLNLHFQYARREVTKKIYRENDELRQVAPLVFDEEVLILHTGYDYMLSDRNSFHFQANYFDWTLDRLRPDNNTTVPDHLEYESSAIMTEAEWSFSPIESSTNILGVNLNLLNGRRYYYLADYYDVGEHNKTTTDYAVYLNGNYKIHPRLNLFYGGRYYGSSYRGIEKSNFSSRAAASLQIHDTVYLKLLYGESFRVPTYLERAVDAPNVIGNPELSPEESRSFDVVLAGSVRDVQWTLDVFYLEMLDRIDRVPIPTEPGLSYANLGEVNFQGAEMSFKFRLNAETFGFGGYSYVTGTDDETDTDLRYTYNHMFSLGASHKLTPRFGLTTSAKYLDTWGEADSYLLLNLGANYIAASDPNLTVGLQVDNVLDQTIEVPEALYQPDIVPPRTVTAAPRVYFTVMYQY